MNGISVFDNIYLGSKCVFSRRKREVLDAKGGLRSSTVGLVQECTVPCLFPFHFLCIQFDGRYVCNDKTVWYHIVFPN